MVIHFQGCKSEQVEGLNVYLGVLSNHGKIFLEGRISRPASVGGFPAEGGMAVAHRGDKDTGSRSSGKHSLA